MEIWRNFKKLKFPFLENTRNKLSKYRQNKFDDTVKVASIKFLEKIENLKMRWHKPSVVLTNRQDIYRYVDIQYLFLSYCYFLLNILTPGANLSNSFNLCWHIWANWDSGWTSVTSPSSLASGALIVSENNNIRLAFKRPIEAGKVYVEVPSAVRPSLEKGVRK